MLDAVIEPAPPQVVLTVPHSLCERPCRSGRTCDCVSGKRALQLELLLREAGVSVVRLSADNYRRDVDLNRWPARNTEYRRTIRRYLQSAERPRLLLDIHSYPAETDRSGWAENSLVLLWEGAQLYPQSILELSRRSGALLVRGERNDIIDEAHENAVPAVLLEFNEDFYRSGDLFSIVNWVVSLVK
jgi:hypothetical protein